MTTRTKTTAVALTGAVALASGAYALGTQSGGGSADAAKAKKATSMAVGKRFLLQRRLVRHGAFSRGQELQSLADKLGVSTDKLQSAFQALRAQKRDDMAQKLADALGIDVSKVKSALDAVRPQGGPPGPPPPGAPGNGPGPGHPRLDFLAQGLADKLGLKESDVQAALDKLSPDDVRAAGGPAEAIAKALDVDVAKVRDALQSLRPPGGPGRRFGHGRGFGPDLSTLADKLGVSTTQLQDAFKKIHDDERDAFATALAQKLGIDPQKVKDALPADGPHGDHGP